MDASGQAAGQEAEITIGDLAHRTGMTPQLLRAWEQRFGFPAPQRTGSGHRRYAMGDVERVRRVLVLKESGHRLERAISQVAGEERLSDAPSVFAELRRLHPEVSPQRLRRRTLIRLSRAIEDEACARARRPVVFGSFQCGELYRRAASRWHELDRTARLCVVFAAFGEEDHDQTLRVDLPPDAPMLREWVVVVWSAEFAAVLAAWEIPGQENAAEGERTYESIFSIDPSAVRTAAHVCLTAARVAGVVRDDALDLDETSAPVSTQAIDALSLRAFGYLDAR